MTDQPTPRPPKSMLLAWGVLQPESQSTVAFRKQLPDGHEVTLLNPLRVAGLALVKHDKTSAQLVNASGVPLSFMLFAVDPRTARVAKAAHQLLNALRPNPKPTPEEPT